MIKIILALFLMLNCSPASAQQEQFTTVDLKYINAEEAMAILKPITDKAISISTTKNTLIIKGSSKSTKNIVQLINKIDVPARTLTIEFVSSKRKMDFTQPDNVYESSSEINSTSQSMTIIERQWVTISTGISIPIIERNREANGTETQSIRYKDVTKNYLLKVHEFNGQAFIQVGINSQNLSNNIAGAIEHTKLDTTIMGKTGEWLELSSGKKIMKNKNETVYSTNRNNENHIYLYIKVTK
jgi:hypothetical protein